VEGFGTTVQTMHTRHAHGQVALAGVLGLGFGGKRDDGRRVHPCVARALW